MPTETGIQCFQILWDLCRTLRNRQCRHTGESRYPVFLSAFWIPGRALLARNDIKGIIQRSPSLAGRESND